jgi:hypothetical protein
MNVLEIVRILEFFWYFSVCSYTYILECVREKFWEGKRKLECW